MNHEERMAQALFQAEELVGVPRKRLLIGKLVNSVAEATKLEMDAQGRIFRHRFIRRQQENTGIKGFGVACIPGRLYVPFGNLVTTAGDQYYARKAIATIAPANASAPSGATGMKLGISTTAAAKSGAGAALVSYLTASNVLFDATYPQVAAVAGTDTGWYAIYQTTWPAGTATSATLNEVVAVNDAATNATSTAANTYARAILSPTVDKAANEPLIVIWNHKFLGA